MKTDEHLVAEMRLALELPADFEISDELEPDNIPGWDSMGWVRIISGIEDRFDVELPLDQVAEIRNVGDLKKIFYAVHGNSAEPTS